MSKDPLALPAITAGLPHEAEYDAVYAAVTATERGRWFLTEFANRNRQADTHLVIAALARIEASIRGDAAPQCSAALWRDLTGIGAAVEQARAAMTAERASAPDLAGVVERIQDISFSLRERAVDASLCDALDAALREISDAYASGKANGKPAHLAAELLHDLAGRVDGLIKLSLTGEDPGHAPSEPPNQAPEAPPPAAVVVEVEHGEEAAAADDDLSQLDRFVMEHEEGKKPSEPVVSLAASLMSAASAIGPQNGFDAATAPPPALDAQSETPAPMNGGARWHIEAPDFFFHPAAPEPEDKPAEDFAEFSQTHALLPETQLQTGPQDDPDDIFESEAGRSANTAPDVAATAVPSATLSDLKLPPEASPAQPQIANGPAAQTPTRRAPSELLAAIRSLNDDELNALFG